MKILIIFTGGTIGSIVKENYISTDDSAKYTLINKYESSHGKIDCDFAVPYSVLSENLTANELNLLRKELASNLGKGYDGIIVTHGTDTLQYTACAIESAFSDCPIPVVFVSSDFPLEDSRSNGHSNFEAAVRFIESKAGCGVFVSYKNARENVTNIHIPSEILQHAECSADIFSISGTPYACYDGKITVCKEKPKTGKGIGPVEYTKDSGILVIDSHPGDIYSYSLDSVKAIILKPYHSATLNTASEDFQAFCNKANTLGIPVFAVNVKSGVSYESTELFDDLGIIPLPYGTYISAYMKIWAAVSTGVDIADFAQKQIADETR